MFEQEFIVDKIRVIINKILPEDIEIVNLQLKGKGTRTILRVLVDRITGGITIDECADINKRLSDELDKKDFFDDRYLLDVSSPGIGYHLKTIRDFERNKNRKLEINFYEPIDERKNFIGQLIDVIDGYIFLKSDSGEKVKISIENIKKAKQTIK